MFRPLRLALASVLLAVALAPAPAEGQLVLPGLESESAVELPVAQDPSVEVISDLENAEESFNRRLVREQDQARWHLERQESRQTNVREERGRLVQRRRELLQFGGPARREAIGRLLAGNRALEELQERIAEARTAYEATLLDGITEARRLAEEAGAMLPVEGVEDTEEVDEYIEALNVRLVQAKNRLDAAESELATSIQKIEERRALLEAARKRMVEQEPDLSRIVGLAPEPTPARDVGEEAPEGESQDAPPAVSEPAPTPLSEAERELIELEEEELRANVVLLERQVELDRIRRRTAEVTVEIARLADPVIRLKLDRWGARREIVAARQKGGLLNVGESLFAPRIYGIAYDHATSLLRDSTRVRAQVKARILDGDRSAAPPPGLLGAVVLLALLFLALVRRLRPLVERWQPKDRGDALARAAVTAALPLLPASGVCALLAWTDAVPRPLLPLFSFGAIAPVSAAVVVATADHLFVPGRETTAGAARYLRTLVRLGTGLASAVLIAASVLPLLGFPAEVRARIGELLVGVLVLNWVLLSVQRQALLEVIGATGDPSSIGVIRAGVRRLYQAFVAGPVLVYALHALGYQNLARFLVRGGLITLGVLLFAPWVYNRMARLLKSAFGYPNGGGWFALSATGARSAVRTIAPLMMMLFGFITLSLIASGWGIGNLGGNLVNALTWPMLEVGGSRISAGSVLLLAVTVSATVLLSRWVITLLRDHVYPLYDLDTGMRATVDTLTRYTIVAVGTLVALDKVGVGTGVITVFAGVIGIGLGFGSQTLMANFISGVILLLARPVAVDSVIEVGGIIGRVVRISGYATVVRTLDNVTVIVPNSEILNTHVVNWNIDTPHVRLQLVVGVAYGSDTALVQKLLLQAAKEHPQVLQDPPPVVRFDDFGDSALVFTLLPWTFDLDGRYVIASDLRFAIDALFAEHGVEIPFPQHDLHIRAGDGEIKLSTLEIAARKGWDVVADDGDEGA